MSRHIVCVDELDLAGLELGSILREIDVDTVSVRDGAEAEAVLQSGEYEFDAMVWALNHVESGSFEEISMLKQKDSCKLLPLIIVSAYTDRKHIIKAIEAGAVEYIAKPYECETVLKKIGRILGTQRTDSIRNLMRDDVVTYSLDEMLTRELKSSSRGNYPVSVMMASIVPQSFEPGLCGDPGELAGLMVRILKTKLRDTDTAFLYGPGSFIVLLPFADTQGAETVEKKVESIFREHTLIRSRNSSCSLVTAFVTCPDHGRIKEKLLQTLEKEMNERIRFAGLQAAVYV